MNKKYVFLPIGVDNANMGILQQLQGTMNGKEVPAMKLRGTKFSSFFKWLSASMGTIVNVDEGQSVSLPNASDWMDIYTI